ncbi:hypothetical protein [Actinomadura sp. 9N407]|uniref:hypothetical protein n=1 Tax=Actinomadura sp. 9N407 TaxID=3375154 RepID=UPI0037BFE656
MDSAAAARRVHEIIEGGVRPGRFRAVDAALASTFAVFARIVSCGGRGLTAGQAFAEIGDILLDRLQCQDPV